MTDVEETFRCFWADDCSWLDVVFSPFTSLMGEATVGMVLGAALTMAFWIHSDDLALPTVITLLLGGVIFTTVPGDIQQLGYGLIVVGGVAGLMEVARQYVL